MGGHEETIEIGPIALEISSADVTAFCAATGIGRQNLDPAAGLPLSYLPTLLGHVLVKPVLIEALGALDYNAEAGLLHLRQDVRATHTLFPDRTYNLRAVCRRDGAERVVITAQLIDPDNGPAAVFESELMRASMVPTP